MKIDIIKKTSIFAIVALMVLVSFSGLTGGYEEKSDERDYTHTVMVEVFTATWCSACPAANLGWHNTYDSGSYDFEYVEMVDDMNTVAANYMDRYNAYYVPTSYYDGGAYNFAGSSQIEYYLDLAGARTVYDIDVAIPIASWIGTAQIEIDIEITNNEASTYDGTARVYILEKTSTLWNDYNGNDYYHAFLDFAAQEDISIGAGETFTQHYSWDGSSEYPSITAENIQVILAVNNDEVHEEYSDGSSTPFDAYYVDDCVAVTPVTNLAPIADFTYTPEFPEINELVSFSDASSDSDGSIVSWDWDFGDGDTSTDQHPTHTYTATGFYDVELTVTDDDAATQTITKTIIVTDVGETISAVQTIVDRGFPIRHAADGDWAGAQNFSIAETTLTRAQLYMRKFGNPEFDLVVELREDGPEGTLHDTLTLTAASFPTAWTWVDIDFTDTSVTPGGDYFIVLPPAPSGVTTSFGYEWGYAFGNQYDGGSFWFTRDGGALWRDLPTSYEFAFCVYGN